MRHLAKSSFFFLSPVHLISPVTTTLGSRYGVIGNQETFPAQSFKLTYLSVYKPYGRAFEYLYFLSYSTYICMVIML